MELDGIEIRAKQEPSDTNSNNTSTSPGIETDEKKPILNGSNRRSNGSNNGGLHHRRRPNGSDELSDGGKYYHDLTGLSYVENAGKSYSDTAKRTLKTLGGVFGPVALGQLSTNVFQRVGFVVGQVGILETIVQFFLAYFILFMTILSICAISTNGAVEGGGAYYMISRALGPEFGGSIGFLFFLANVFSCALYIAAFTEGLIDNFGEGGTMITDGMGYLPSGTSGSSKWWMYLYETCIAIVCCCVCLVGAAMFAKTSLFILFVVVVCFMSVIISFLAKKGPLCVDIPTTNHIIYNSTINYTICENYTGLSLKTFEGNLWDQTGVDYNTGNVMTFVTVFAILFSSVTGIMNGANMSGELKEPGYSIPLGTMGASVFTLSTYIVLAILTAFTCSRELLMNKYGFMQDVNLWPPFVVIGIFAATLSASLGNLIGASRVLEALARDELFWIFLSPAKITTKSGNPVIAVLISWVLVQAVMLIGSLNAIAPITSVFFLLSYAATNLACLALELASAPNFRPTFRYFSWYTCLLGLVGCLVMCFLIQPVFAAVAIIVTMLFVILLHFRSLPTTWGSISQALIFHQVRKYLLLLDSRKEHVKYWRPQILLMVSNPRACAPLIKFANDAKKSGLYILGHVEVSDFDSDSSDPVQEANNSWLELVDRLKVKAFVELTVARSIRDGMHHLIRISGLGGMKPNMVMFGFYDDKPPSENLTALIERKRRRGDTNGSASSSGENGDFTAAGFSGEVFGDLRAFHQAKHLTVDEYVQMIADAIKMQKNVSLCRHFERLDRDRILSCKKPMFIDAWPVNFFRPDSVTYFDTSCLFLLQLSCILHMVRGWKAHTVLRVFLCVDAREDDVLAIERKLDQLLRQLRIIAEVKIITWERVTAILDHEVTDGDDDRDDDFDFPEDYVAGMNQIIREQSSENTAVTFCYLPAPPRRKNNYQRYLNQIDKLTAGLPPTVLVHGLHPVTSTTL
ncbi:solute carrier family 12 member 9-like isoform X2 [Tubulanus polymorphus]|uniref:solute carrier family 12 member 9-like isoform X2 n=1 Tax=Tubulanus polymorphus TaxID=672921 RepID=UPI003DA216A1